MSKAVRIAGASLVTAWCANCFVILFLAICELDPQHSVLLVLTQVFAALTAAMLCAMFLFLNFEMWRSVLKKDRRNQ